MAMNMYVRMCTLPNARCYVNQIFIKVLAGISVCGTRSPVGFGNVFNLAVVKSEENEKDEFRSRCRSFPTPLPCLEMLD